MFSFFVIVVFWFSFICCKVHCFLVCIIVWFSLYQAKQRWFLSSVWMLISGPCFLLWSQQVGRLMRITRLLQVAWSMWMHSLISSTFNWPYHLLNTGRPGVFGLITWLCYVRCFCLVFVVLYCFTVCKSRFLINFYCAFLKEAQKMMPSWRNVYPQDMPLFWFC